MSQSPKISIITVVYNSERLIEATIQSVLNQEFKNIEYIIIDGGSTDKTVDIIKKHDDKISYWVSEPDDGIYDAMNKGLQIANGEYLLFINSGDKIFDKLTLENVFMNGDADIFYGDTMIINEKDEELGLRRLRPPKQLTFKSLKNGMLVCHQSFIIKKDNAPLFDISYKYSSDFDWVIKSVKNTKKIYNTDQVISKFMEGGQTSNTVYKGLKERFLIMKKYYGLFSAIMQNLLLIPRFFGYLITKKI